MSGEINPKLLGQAVIGWQVTIVDENLIILSRHASPNVRLSESCCCGDPKYICPIHGLVAGGVKRP